MRKGAPFPTLYVLCPTEIGFRKNKTALETAPWTLIEIVLAKVTTHNTFWRIFSVFSVVSKWSLLERQKGVNTMTVDYISVSKLQKRVNSLHYIEREGKSIHFTYAPAITWFPNKLTYWTFDLCIVLCVSTQLWLKYWGTILNMTDSQGTYDRCIEHSQFQLGLINFRNGYLLSENALAQEKFIW